MELAWGSKGAGCNDLLNNKAAFKVMHDRHKNKTIYSNVKEI